MWSISRDLKHSKPQVVSRFCVIQKENHGLFALNLHVKKIIKQSNVKLTRDVWNFLLSACFFFNTFNSFSVYKTQNLTSVKCPLWKDANLVTSFIIYCCIETEAKNSHAK